MQERFNLQGAHGRDCPMCARVGSLVQRRDGLLDCDPGRNQTFARASGCGALFHIEGGDTLVRLPPGSGRYLTFAELEAIRGGAA